MSTSNSQHNANDLETLKAWRSRAGTWLQIASGLGLMAGWLLIAQAGLLASIVNDVVFNEVALAQLIPLLLAMLGIFALRAALAWGSEQAALQGATQVKLAVRMQLYRHVQQLGPAWLRSERSGEVVNTLSDGVEALEAYYARYVPTMTLVVWLPLSIVVFVFANDWVSGLIMLLTAPLIPLFMMLIGKGTEQLNQTQWQTLARLSAHFLDTLQGLTTLKLFNASRREAAVIARISDEYRQRTMAVLRVAFLSSFVLEFFASLSIAIVAVLVGFQLYWGELPFLQGFFVLLLAPEFYLPLRNMGTHYHARLEAIGAVERMVTILNTPLPQRTSASHQATTPAAPQTLQTQALKFEHLSFNYPDGRVALRDINLSIAPGETLALVGSSGAGKTTLIQVLMGFLPLQHGQIWLGDTPLSQVALDAWWQQIAWLPQQPQLFTGTVAENIALGQAIDEKRVQQAAAQAQAHEFIQALPQAYATRIGEAGHGLSGGQLQRIGLARAFYKDAPLVILDEATANLDRDSERQIQQALQKLAEGRTVIMIAHRLSTVRHADRIAVLENGALVDVGTHTALLQDCPAYQAMLQAYGDAL